MSDLAVTLTVAQLRALVREAVADAIREASEPREPTAPISDEEHASARARWLRKMGGKR
jgi:hypothetical protein